MKILMISHMYPSNFNEVGGIFVHQRVKELKRQGHEVIVISPIPWTPFPIKYLSKKWKAYSKIPKRMVWDSIEAYYPRYLAFPKALSFASSGKRMYWGIKKTVSEIYKNFKFDIIHSHVALPDGYCGMIIAQKYNKPLTVTIHGQDFYQTIFKNKKCKKNIEKVINFSNKTIVVSDKLKKISEEKLNINPQKLITIPNGINIEDIHKRKNNLIKQYEGKKIVLSVSYLIKRKGIDYNLRAISKLKRKYPEIIYLIIGDGPERKNLENLAKKLTIEDRIQFLGLISNQKTMEYLSICDIFSLPSWNEAFGVVYLEAMANSKPAIACQGEGIDGIIRNKETGILVEPKNVDSLVEAIDYLLSNPEKAKKIGETARKLILENYTWTNVVKKIIEIYNNNSSQKCF